MFRSAVGGRIEKEIKFAVGGRSAGGLKKFLIFNF